MTDIEAIEWLKQIRDKYIHGGDEWFDEQRCRAIEYAIECIYKRNKWIPVSERLPEVGTGDVLVARSYKGKPYVDIGEFINGTACCWGDEYAINPREHITTHWMPLPEPPEEVSNGQT